MGRDWPKGVISKFNPLVALLGHQFWVTKWEVVFHRVETGLTVWCILTDRRNYNAGLVSDLSQLPNPHHFSSNQEIKKKLDDSSELPAPKEQDEEDIEIDRSPDTRFIKYKKEVCSPYPHHISPSNIWLRSLDVKNLTLKWGRQHLTINYHLFKAQNVNFKCRCQSLTFQLRHKT